jgi:hypothetical protein
MEQEIEFVSKINNELNINGKFITIGDMSVVFYGYSSSLNINDFIKINQEIKRLTPIGITHIYNFDSFNVWENSYEDVNKSIYLLIFKNSNLLYYRLNTKKNIK